MNQTAKLTATALLAAFACAGAATAQEIEISKSADFLGRTPPTPIAIEGFTGEVNAVLNYDLFVMGFTNVPADSANYILSGGNDGEQVKGQLLLGRPGIKMVSGTTISATAGRVMMPLRAYSGSSLRRQAHRLADDVVKTVTSVNGIAETRIAFKVDTGKTSEIYVADFDGHDPVAATQDHNIVAAPCWVPGKFALYYSSYLHGDVNIYYHNLGTGERRDFAHYPGMNSSAAVSPDGSKVAMILSKGGSPDVYVCDADGSNLKQLTSTREDESSPCWSPDGQWICFATKINERRGLAKVPAAGGAIQRLATIGVANPTEPDWSPDGKWIAFTSQMGGFDICVVPANGGNAVALVAGEDPCWAWNSRNLIFVRRTGGRRVLSLLDVPTKHVKDVSRVSGSNSSNSQPSWDR